MGVRMIIKRIHVDWNGEDGTEDNRKNNNDNDKDDDYDDRKEQDSDDDDDEKEELLTLHVQEMQGSSVMPGMMTSSPSFVHRVTEPETS